ncbi:MAG: glucokinase [Pseudomonadota bacterium]
MAGQSHDTTELAVIDMGGTHARFAMARIDPGGAVSLGAVTTLRVADHADPLSAWSAYRAQTGGRPPRNVALAVAAMTGGDTIDFPNSAWRLHKTTLKADLECERAVIVHDFEAVAHAAARARDDQFLPLAGPDAALPSLGTISVIGPGTGLGVAYFHRDPSGRVRVQATEGSHGSFGPVDAFEDALLARLRARFGRVSNERVAAGPAILDIYAALADADGERAALGDAVAIWQAGLSDKDALAAQAVERFCLILGSVAGDIALAQGSGGVVIAGGLGYRMREALQRSGFAERFAAKGRYTDYMKSLPVKIIEEAQPGLIGAAAAFASAHL